MDMVDQAILTTFPLLAVGRSAGCEPATESGIRYLAASDGLWREVNLPWIRVLHPLATTILPLPYGQLQMVVDVKCGPVPVELIRDFNTMARAAAPREIAAALIWNEATEMWRLAERPAISSSAEDIHYREVDLHAGDHLVVDMHSHGHYPAFFSGEDDRDDAGTMRFSLVVGSFNNEQPSAKMRLCMAGITLPAQVRDGQLHIVNKEDA